MAIQLNKLLSFKKTHISLRRPIWDYAAVQSLISVIRRNKKFQLRKAVAADLIYCNIGCGPNIFPNFVNIDYFWKPGIDICWDITKGLPFGDESVEGIFIEHVLEHFSARAAKIILREFYRILKKGKIIRVIVPDGQLYAELYIKSGTDKSVRFPYAEESDNKTPMLYLNDLFYRHEHKMAYDAQTLSKFLSEAGFEDIRKECFRHGQDKILLIDREGRRSDSLYMEAKK